MNPPTTILIFYAVLFEYQLSTFKILAEKFNCKLVIVYWDHIIQIPIKVPDLNNITFIPRSKNNYSSLVKIAKDCNPDLICTSGWMDKSYVKIARYFRNNTNVPTIMFSDARWNGSFKQRVFTFVSKLYLKSAFTNICVAGSQQFEYAKLLGFNGEEIIFNLYSANTNEFYKYTPEYLKLKEKKYPHTFAFVGRFVERKGIRLLIKAWEELKNIEHDWQLKFIGCGQLEDYIKSKANVNNRISVEAAKTTEEIARECFKIGCFVLPSFNEPWGVVLHEFAAGGIPIISSNDAGANSFFLIPGFNGYSFKSGDHIDLANKLKKVILSSDEHMLILSKNSYSLSNRITPEISAASFISVLSN
jgi:glycosyltransferase involved in cell wall biosynthesis